MKALRRGTVMAGGVAVFLVAMLVMFWTIDILPLVLFGGVIVVYAFLSSRQMSQRKTRAAGMEPHSKKNGKDVVS